MRIDKWLWAARFFKTRSLAQQAIASGQVKLNEERVRPAHEVKVGDVVVVRKEEIQWVISVKQLSDKRRSAEIAKALYEESAESVAERQRRQDLRRLSPEPAAGRKGRPTKRERRQLDRMS